MISDQRRREIVAAFQASFKRDNSVDLDSITLEELIAADEMLGPRDLNEGFRLRMRNRIATLQEQQAAKQESKSKWLDRGLGVIVGIALTLLGVWLAN
jgi:hypothetical protein